MDWSSDDSTDRTWQNGLKAAGSSMRQSGSDMTGSAREAFAQNADRLTPMYPSYKRGGTVRKTGLARLHKGEFVVKRSKVKEMRKLMRERGRSR